MTACARLGDSTSCGDVIVEGSGNVFCNGLPVSSVGDGTSGHASWIPNNVAEGSSTVFVNGKAVARVGDKHTGHASPTPGAFHQTAIIVGSPNVFVGD